MAKGTCTADDCERIEWARGLCGLHYGRRWRTGATELASRPTTAQRFWAMVDKAGPVPEYRPDLGPCWIWTGYVMPSGYGFWQHTNGTIKTSAHRFAFELADEAIPDGLHVDHLCRNRACVRRSHLEAVTQAENNSRSWAARGLKTHCKNGHPLSGENLHIATTGQRVCRACRNARVRAFKERARRT